MLKNANKWFKMANEEANMGEDWNLEIPSQSSGFFNGNQTYGAIGGSKMATEEANIGESRSLTPPSRLSSFFGKNSPVESREFNR